MKKKIGILDKLQKNKEEKLEKQALVLKNEDLQKEIINLRQEIIDLETQVKETELISRELSNEITVEYENKIKTINKNFDNKLKEAIEEKVQELDKLIEEYDFNLLLLEEDSEKRKQELDDRELTLEEEYESKKEKSKERFSKEYKKLNERKKEINKLDVQVNDKLNSLKEELALESNMHIEELRESLNNDFNLKLLGFEKTKKDFANFKDNQISSINEFKRKSLEEIKSFKCKSEKELSEKEEESLNLIKEKEENFIRETESMYNAKLQELERLEEELMLKIKKLEDDLSLEKEKFNAYKANELEAIKNEKDKSLKELESKKLDDIKEIECKVEEFESYIKERKLNISNFEQKSLAEIKISLDNLQHEKEVFEKQVSKQYMEERKQRLKENKRDFLLSEQTIFGTIYQFSKRHKYISGFLTVLAIIAVIYYSFVLSYKINPKEYISSGINENYTTEAYSSDTFVFFEIPDELEGFDILRDSTVNIHSATNKSLNEYYNKYTLVSGTSEFNWERFYKNKTAIMKTPYEPQYIIVEDYEERGFIFNPESGSLLFNQPVIEMINLTSFKDIENIQKISMSPSLTIPEHIINILTGGDDYLINFKINNKTEANKLFKSMLVNFINNDNFKSFMNEEDLIQQRLEVDNNLDEMQFVLETLMKNSTINNVVLSTTSDETKKISIVDLEFFITYHVNGQDFNFKMKVNKSIRETDRNVSLENPIFDDNSTPIELLFPRNVLEEYKEPTSVKVQEDIGTLKEMEEDGVEFDGETPSNDE